MPPPKSAKRRADLEKQLSANARAAGIAVERYRENFNRTMLLEALERAVAQNALHGYLLKGASAIELRYGTSARATRDIDIELPIPLDRLAAVFAEVLAVGFDDFTFRLRGSPKQIRDEAVRVAVEMRYLDRSWATLDVDLAPALLPEAANDVQITSAEIPLVSGKARTMTTAYVIAQKIHAVTMPEPLASYARHIVDLVFLASVGVDTAEVRAACQAVFVARSSNDRRTWPPTDFAIPQEWETNYQATIDLYGLRISTADVSTRFTNFFVELIGGIIMPGYEYRFVTLRYFRTPQNPQESTFSSPIETNDPRYEGFANLTKDGWRVQTAIDINRIERPELLLVLERELPS